MKHKYTLAQNLRYWFSHIFCQMQCLVSSPTRPNGISVMIRVKNEEDWIAKSLLSLNNFADEAVIINNNSSDMTLAEIQKIRPKLNYRIHLETEKSNDICKISNLALARTSYRWIFRWDSDFIAHTGGENNIIFLREYLLRLNPQRHYLIFPLTVSLAGDLFHVKTSSETNSEGYIHTWHPKLKYQKKGKFEVLRVPNFYKIVRTSKIHFIHIGSAKPWRKLLDRFFWLYWQNHLAEFTQLEDFIDHELREKYQNLKALDFTIKEFRRLILPISKYDETEFGAYPALLEDDLKNPRLKVIYKDDKPFSRNDFDE
jgi:glycosyltransferase involved in cell wall biosynthesis